MQMSALDDVSHSLNDSHAHALEHNVGDDDGPYDRCILGGSGDANIYDPNINDELCNDKDATNLANSPNRKANASTPKMAPRTNRK